MRIEHDFDYDASCEELADEFCEHNSEYQANFFNEIGSQFKIWSQDKTRTYTYIQILEIAEQLNDNGKWFVKTLCEYMTEAKNVDCIYCANKDDCQYSVAPDDCENFEETFEHHWEMMDDIEREEWNAESEDKE